MARRQRSAMLPVALPIFYLLIAVVYGGKDKPVRFYCFNILSYLKSAVTRFRSRRITVCYFSAIKVV